MIVGCVASVTAALLSVSVAAAPPARAGCQSTYFGWNNGRTICDGPERPDGGWDRCLYAGGGKFGGGFSNCFPVSPDAIPFGQPPHIYGPMMPGVPTNGFGV
ncbi:hypothetical protein KIH27_18080 [Mycobacterium sp. M1]|uniref:CDGP domain-containing protein n=1 Tax=Mycolicibacter acidiphilus TaxID=2835306 RepID=A0ABS5RN99_9MYCO|nr:hypothetical protein [Mycolicibacter acidiphilus]